MENKTLLNADQQRAIPRVSNWFSYDKENPFYVIEGPGGVGKTFFVRELEKVLNLKEEILYIAPTHEALYNLKSSVGDGENFLTSAAALGFIPSVKSPNQDELIFEQTRPSKLWNDVRLAVVDEASMITEQELALLHEQKTKILLLGDRNQLPPVTKSNVISSQESPAFVKGYPTTKFYQPMRHTGPLWDFNQNMAAWIYDQNLQAPSQKDLDISLRELKGYFLSETFKCHLDNDQIKLIAWTRNSVFRLNSFARRTYFNAKADLLPYEVGDRIILTKPYTLFPSLDKASPKEIETAALASDRDYFFCNTKGIILSVTKTIVTFAKKLILAAWKLKIKTLVGESIIFAPVDSTAFKQIADYYRWKAYNTLAPDTKIKNFKLIFAMQAMFAEISHAWAYTSHRSQGSTIENVVVFMEDILKNPRTLEARKCAYVATSRTKEDLAVYRGDISYLGV